MDGFQEWRQVFEALKDGLVVRNQPEVPAAVCPTCDGTGYIRYDVPVADPRFGKMFRCTNPNCPAAVGHDREQAKRLMNRSSWSDAYNHLTFDSFYALMDGLGEWRGKRGAYAAALAFATFQRPFTLTEAAQHTFGLDWPDADGRISASVVLSGGVGTGKTGLGVAAVNALLAQAQKVIFIRMLDLIDAVQDTYDRSVAVESTEDCMRRFTQVPYLVLDEFGIKNYRPDRLEIVEDLIRGRDRFGNATLITTNLTLEQVYDVWQPQIADIVAKAHWVPVAGVKLRQAAQKAANATW